MRTIVFALSALCLSLVTVPAHADIPPPAGYVEACTAAVQQRPNEHCEECGANFSSVGQCAQHYASTAFTKRCQSYGASVWTEVWCDGPATAPLPAPAAAQPHPGTASAGAQTAPAAPVAAAHGCGSCTVGAQGGLGGALLVVAGLAALVAARRRRR